MGYDTDIDPYLDPATGVLRNLLGITTEAELAGAEADLTAVALATLAEHPIAGNFDFTHLQAIHQHLFGELYDWAGTLRTVDVTKGNTRFANVEFLSQAAQAVFTALRDENFLDDLDDERYITRLAHYFSEINVLHPFREGNGRTQRAFFTLLAARTGRTIAWDRLDANKNIQACVAAYEGDERPLVELLEPLVL